MEKIRVTQIRSTIKNTQRQKDTIRSLGLGKINRTVEHNLTPQIKGMINKVAHLVITEKI